MNKGLNDNEQRTVPAFLVRVKGLVQGVGFRPFVYRLAMRFGYEGWVENRNDGVHIFIAEPEIPPEAFLDALRREAPAASEVESVDMEASRIEPVQGFHISRSSDHSGDITEISPDIAVCDECLRDMEVQPHRLDYPLINCIHCGPRFTIIRALPYDRHHTTMEPFAMCSRCASEYGDIADRRFHAQPVACNHCGPVYSLAGPGGQVRSMTFRQQLELTSELIASGETVALKGTGGFHLICDALNHQAVNDLRKRKKRDGKPLAVMFRDPESVRRYATLNLDEEALLKSWRRPVVLVPSQGFLPPLINSGLDTLGAILPYMPVHHLLFRHLKTDAVVFTSGNISDEPVEKDEAAAIEHLQPVAHHFLYYNREIYNRADDSVVRVMDGKPVVLRRSRGFVPKPVRLGFGAEGIFAAGAELKNTFCIGKGNQAILSQHTGDLKNRETYDFYIETVERFRGLFRFAPRLAAVDMHHDYLSTRFAEQMGIPVERVQHHHAHIASCMAEHQLDEPVLGLAFDGTGLGEDGHIWGSEIMVAGLDTYERRGHLSYIPLAGGDRAVEEPWRIALALLHDAYGPEGQAVAGRLFPGIREDLQAKVLEAIEKQVNVTLSCGMGRLFDGVAALLGICLAPAFEAEGPMRMEAISDKGETGFYPLAEEAVLSLAPLVRNIVNDKFAGVPAGVIAARFHRTVAFFATGSLVRLRDEFNINKAVLSGGTFQNRFLTEMILSELRKQKFITFIQSQVPCNDGGISLGQLAVAAKRRSLQCV